MKIYLFFAVGITCLLLVGYHAGTTKTDAVKATSRMAEPPDEVKLVLENYEARQSDLREDASDLEPSELKLMNDYLHSVEGTSCTIEYWESGQPCSGPCPSDPGQLRRSGYLMDTSCGTTCVVSCFPALRGDGC